MQRSRISSYMVALCVVAVCTYAPFTMAVRSVGAAAEVHDTSTQIATLERMVALLRQLLVLVQERAGIHEAQTETSIVNTVVHVVSTGGIQSDAAQGADGAAGADGADGAHNGADGHSGDDGADGERGEDGTDG